MMAKQATKDVRIEVDLSLYPLEAVQSAVYTLSDRFKGTISRKGKEAVSVALTPKSEGVSAGAADLFGEELLHEALRLQVSQANQKIREYIVTKALVSAQVPSVLPPATPAPAAPAAQESCPECEAQQAPAAAPAPVDAELEKEIEKLLAEIEKGDGAADPLGVAVPWEEKYGGKPAKEGKEPKTATAAPKAKAAKTRAA